MQKPESKEAVSKVFWAPSLICCLVLYIYCNLTDQLWSINRFLHSNLKPVTNE